MHSIRNPAEFKAVCAPPPAGHQPVDHSLGVRAIVLRTGHRRLVWGLGVKRLIARRGTGHGSGVGMQRQLVERRFAPLRWCCRLRIGWGIRDGIHEAFFTLGCALVCWRRRHSLRRAL